MHLVRDRMSSGELWFRVCGCGVERQTAQVRRDSMYFPLDWSDSLFSPSHHYQALLFSGLSHASPSMRALLQAELSLCLENSTGVFSTNTTSPCSSVSAREKGLIICLSKYLY